MDRLACRILREQVAPVIEEMLDPSKAPISEHKFEWTKDLVDIAKDLLECDVLLKKLGKPDPEEHNPKRSPTMDTPSFG